MTSKKKRPLSWSGFIIAAVNLIYLSILVTNAFPGVSTLGYQNLDSHEQIQSVYSDETDHPIPWQIDQVFIWQET